MNRAKAIAWLRLCGCKVPEVQPRASWVVSDCPLGPWRHEEGKSGPEVFGVRVEMGDSFCNCFSCGWAGSQTDLVFKLKELNTRQPHRKYPLGELLGAVEDAADELDLSGLSSPDVEEMLFAASKDTVHAFPEKWLSTFPQAADAGVLGGYLDARGVGPAVAGRLDLRYDPNEQRACFPVRDFAGLLVGLHGRSLHEEVEPRYRMYLHGKRNNPEFWLGEHWIDLERPVVQVEGPFDVASVLRVYRNVASPLYALPGLAKLRRMADATKVVTLLDSGKAGDQGRARAKKAFKDSEVVNLEPPEGVKDPGVMSVQMLQDLLGPHVVLDEEIS